MNRPLTAILLLLVLLLPKGSSGAETLSYMAYDGPPYYITTAGGKWGGMNVELIQALAERAGMTAQPKELPWNRAMMSLENGQLDVIVELSQTPERAEFVHFLGLSFYEQIVIIVRKKQAAGLRKTLQTLDDMARQGYFWGLRENVFYSDELNARLQTDLAFAGHFDAVAYLQVNLDRLKIGRLTGVLGPIHTVSHQLEHDPSLGELTFISVPFLPPSPNYFGVSGRIAPEKLARLKKAYRELADEGVFRAIERKWAPGG